MLVSCWRIPSPPQIWEKQVHRKDTVTYQNSIVYVIERANFACVKRRATECINLGAFFVHFLSPFPEKQSKQRKIDDTGAIDDDGDEPPFPPSKSRCLRREFHAGDEDLYCNNRAGTLSLSPLRVMIQNVVLVESERFILIDLSLSAFAARGLLSDDDPS